MRIRNFDRQDFSRVIDIEMESFSEHNPYAYMYFYEMNPDGFFVAEEGGKILGFVAGYPDEEGEGRVFTLAVRKGYRRKGIGSHLLGRILRKFRQSGIRYAKLEVRENNVGAIRMYRRMGFLPCGYEPEYYSDGEWALVMKKRLFPAYLAMPEVPYVDILP